ncbi:MAG: hypothetical protein DME04_13370 [Candidatus Rokuibacteriota bacterium]|nr:MAG: hypothetical protein DME04_13370 [Candidatus Rokubacteria bacterium]
MAATRPLAQGYLVLADISGYTSFLTHTELEHAHGIVAELTSLVIARLGDPLRFVELEGDAVFAYAPAAAFADPERLLDMIKACYVAFQLRLDEMRRATTCTCSACAAIGALDLKFIAHLGCFVLQETPTGAKPIGPDVILVHRLLKNRVIEMLGTRAYALLTDALLERAGSTLGPPAHAERSTTSVRCTGASPAQADALAARRARDRGAAERRGSGRGGLGEPLRSRRLYARAPGGGLAPVRVPHARGHASHAWWGEAAAKLLHVRVHPGRRQPLRGRDARARARARRARPGQDPARRLGHPAAIPRALRRAGARSGRGRPGVADRALTHRSFTPYFSSVSSRSSRPSPGVSGTAMNPSTIFGRSRNSSNQSGSRVGSANDSRMKPVGLAATACTWICGSWWAASGI